MSYVKNYDVGSIRLDAPRTDFIYELPLLSFGDVQHTIGLSLVFNSRFATSNPFYMANGYKLNMQKRLIMSNNVPLSYEDGYGRIVNLILSSGRYVFDDDTQRVLRRFQTNGTYSFTLEYPDYSYEEYDHQGRIISATDKYGVTYLSFAYYLGKLSSITYRSNKIINFVYGSMGALNSITYSYNGSAVCTTNIAYNGSAHAIVTHYSGVKYYVAYSGGSFYAYSTDGGATYSDSYSHRLDCTKTNASVVIQKKIGSKVIDGTQYDFLKLSSDNKIAIMDVTDFHGVKTRMHFSDEYPVYSYEMSDNMFISENGNTHPTYFGKINYHVKDQMAGTQGYTDGVRMTYIVNDYEPGYDMYISDQDPGQPIMLSGWIKSVDNVEDCGIIIYDAGEESGTIYIGPLVENSWVYFTVPIPELRNSNGQIRPYASIFAGPTVTTDRVEMADFRLIYNDESEHAITVEDVFIDSALQSFTINKDLEFYFDTESEDNKLNLTDDYITANDILRYQINKARGTNTNEVYLCDCRKILLNSGTLKVKLDESLVPVLSLSVGKKQQHGSQKCYLTQNTVSVGNNLLTTSSYKNGVKVGERICDTSLDVVKTTSDGVTTIYQYLSDSLERGTGLVTKKTIGGSIITSAVYNLDEFKLVSTTDEFGTITLYTTDAIWGVVTGSELIDGTVVTDQYDGDNSTILKRTFDTDSDGIKTHSFSYTNGNLSGLSLNDTSYYSFDYSYGSLSGVSKFSSIVEQHALSNSDKTLSSFYPSQSSALYSVVSHTDNYGRLTEVEGVVENTYDIAPMYINGAYCTAGADNSSGKLATSTDKTNNNVTKYAYDNDKISKIGVFNSSGTKLSEEEFNYDAAGRSTGGTFTYGDKSVSRNIIYIKNASEPDADNKLRSVSYKVNGTTKLQSTLQYDSLSRLCGSNITLDNQTYYFTKGIIYDKTRVSTLSNNFRGQSIGQNNYEYDLHGRITKDTYSSYYVTSNSTDYIYDGFGQLVRENNKALDKTFVYSYNGIGNIANVKTYAYTTGAVSGTPVITSYTYDGTQVDRLASFGGKAITYDANGCVNTYDDWTYTWTKGRLTKRVRGTRLSGIDTYTYTYDAYGRRTSKTYRFTKGTQALAAYMTSSSTNYTYDASGRLIREQYTEIFNDLSSNSREIIYLYDENGVIGVMYSYNGSTSAAYFYRRNLQGDVTAIYNREGNRVGEYAYDAWGNCTILSGASNDLVSNNPIRYRGYYFDAESGVYFLNARYYTPQWRRFISPDSTDYLDPESVNGLNLYAYCGNDPVNYADPSGHAWETVFDVGFALWSLYDYYNDPSLENLGWFALDIIALFVPFLPGGSKVVTKIDEIADISKFMSKYDEVIALGQSMNTRVIPYADEIGAAVYGGLTNFKGLEKTYGTVFATFIGYSDNMAFIIKESLKGAKFIDIGFDATRTLNGLKGMELFTEIASRVTIYSERFFSQLFRIKNVFRYFRYRIFRGEY